MLIEICCLALNLQAEALDLNYDHEKSMSDMMIKGICCLHLAEWKPK